MEHSGETLKTSKKTKRVTQKKKNKKNIVVGQSSFPQTMFADDGNRSPYI